VGRDRVLPDIFLKYLDSLDMEFIDKKADNGTLVFRDPEFKIFDSKIFKKNSRFALIAGWEHELVPMGPFYVKGLDPVAPENGTPTLTVHFQDKSHIMNKKSKKKRWVGTPTSIIKKIARHHDLGYDVDDITGLSFTDDFSLTQANISDARLMQILATRYGYVWGVDGHNLYFKRPEDLEESGEHDINDVPILTYRSRDCSLRSFTPRIRTLRGGKKKGAKTGLGGIKELGNAAVDGLGELAKEMGIDSKKLSDLDPGLGDLLNLSDDEERNDDEESVEDDKENDIKSQAGDVLNYLIDPIKATFDFGDPKTDDGAEVTGPADASGAASPSNEEDANKRLAAKVLKTSEIIDGDAIPEMASMRYRPRMPIIFAGLGERLSTKYTITKVKQSWGRGKPFRTVLHVRARRLKSNARVKRRIDEETKGQDTPGSLNGSGSGSPGKVVPSISIDVIRAKVTLVNGQQSD
jgi:phage protein D